MSVKESGFLRSILRRWSDSCCEKDSSIKSIDDLKGKKLAVKNGTTGAKFATDNADKYGYEVVQFNDSPSMFQEVSNGNADALIEIILSLRMRSHSKT